MTSVNSLFDVSKEIVVVTGGSGQLGAEYIQIFLDNGARVVNFDLADRHGHHPPNDKQKYLFCEVNITSKASLQRGLACVEKAFGTPTVLINNAAIDTPPGSQATNGASFEEFSEDVWDKTMDVNLKGVFMTCQVIGGRMAANERGSIINISSIYGILSPDQRVYGYRAKMGKPFFKPITYSVSKSGILNLTRYLATYWAEKNVRVNTLTLGGVFNNQDEEFIRNYTQRVPLGRMAQASEYNGAILFLASQASSYMTGSNLIVDGGWSAW